MKRKVGETLKEIRINLGLTEKAVYDGIVARSTFQKIEKDLQSPSFEKIELILERLCISQKQFEFIRNNFQLDEKEQILVEFRQMGYTVELDKINAMLKKINDLLEVQHDEMYVNLKILLESFALFQKTQNLALVQEKAVEIWNKLEMKDRWYYEDIILIMNILYVFPPGTLEHKVDRLLKFVDQYKLYEPKAAIDVVVKLNYATFLKLNGRMLEAKEMVDEIIDIAHSKQLVLYEQSALFKKAEIMLTEGKVKEATLLAEEVFITVDRLNFPALLDDFKLDWDLLHTELGLEK
ncbi:helix-turn-helix domain-containing protein [Listeria booriae]|uniref:Helix-turn-helix transcriptional regulator n=1 Tax=Listeria booriae TaxID=1552123 RepID=A0A842F0F4_9LIST|nr:helix-turn-helix transcriptional regulator [Listeria booriae]MBC2242258.1 helix-turn-helix transcriptional regulator [Listeria booriae]